MRRKALSHPLPKTLAPILAVLAGLLLASPAAADWLVTPTGETIETHGPWKVTGRIVVYQDVRGKLSALPLDEVDLDASRTVTEAGGPASAESAAEPSTSDERQRRSVLVLTNDDVPRATATASREPGEDVEETAAPRVTLYATSWCGYCRKTRELLTELGVEFVEKDIEKSLEARTEHAAKARGAGVPVLDVDGEIVRGYRPETIRELVAKLDNAEPAEPEAAEEP